MVFMKQKIYGRRVLNGHFAQFSQDMKHTISTRWLANPIEAVAIFLIIFGAHMNTFLKIKINKYIYSCVCLAQSS